MVYREQMSHSVVFLFTLFMQLSPQFRYIHHRNNGYRGNPSHALLKDECMVAVHADFFFFRSGFNASEKTETDQNTAAMLVPKPAC